MQGYDQVAWLRLVEWGKSVTHEVQGVCVIPPPVGQLAMVGLRMAASTLRMAGTDFELVGSVEEAMHKHRLRWPDAEQRQGAPR